MQIWVMRHGEAGFNAKTDNQRSLTEQGQKMAFKQGQWLEKRLIAQNVSIDKIIVSPYLRTMQTLEHLLLGMQAVSSLQSFANLSDLVETWEGVTPMGQVDNVVDYLNVLEQTNHLKNVLIISHLPLVYELVQQLTNDQHSVHFYPAVIAELAWREYSGKLLVAEYP